MGSFLNYIKLGSDSINIEGKGNIKTSLEREFVEEPKKGIKEEVQVEKENNNLDIKKLIGAMNVILEECSSIREEISELKALCSVGTKNESYFAESSFSNGGFGQNDKGSLLSSNDTQKNIGGMSDDHIASILG